MIEKKARIVQALNQADVIIVNAGSSAGSEDYTSDIIKDLGELVAWSCNTPRKTGNARVYRE